ACPRTRQYSEAMAPQPRARSAAQPAKGPAMSPFDPAPDILEATLRDGSYLIDFQFTADDTATVASALEAVGFRWIEVGHGVGMNASAAGKGRAAASDEEYLEAAG